MESDGRLVCGKCGRKNDPISAAFPWLLNTADNTLKRVKILSTLPQGSILIGDKCANKMQAFKWPNDTDANSTVSLAPEA
jgi:hypothetical protein